MKGLNNIEINTHHKSIPISVYFESIDDSIVRIMRKVNCSKI